MQKIKVLHIINNFAYGGAEMMLYKVLLQTNREVWQPFLICLNGEGGLKQKFEQLNIPIEIVGLETGKVTLNGLLKLINLQKKIQPDLVQGWMYHSNLASTVSTFFANRQTPVVWNIPHSLSSIKNEKKSTARVIRLLSILSWFPEKIIYNSKTSAKQHEKIGYRANKSLPFPDGFLVDKFVPSTYAYQQLRQELALSSDAIIIGRIARYHPMKDYFNLLDAAAELLKNNSQVHFVLVGPNVDYDNRELTEKIKELNIQDHVHLLGIRDDTPTLNAGFDISCTTSAWGEGFPNVVGEAMSCGVPCVVTDVGDSAWLVGDTGLVVPPCDSGALAEAWEKLINNTPLRQDLGAKARQRIVDNFALTQIVSNYENLYKNILGIVSSSVYKSKV